MLVAIRLVYLILVILVRLLLAPVVILSVLPLAVVGTFVALAMAGCALELSALIGLLMLRREQRHQGGGSHPKRGAVPWGQGEGVCSEFGEGPAPPSFLPRAAQSRESLLDWAAHRRQDSGHVWLFTAGTRAIVGTGQRVVLRCGAQL
jgi:hypothetical protein